MLHVVRLVLDVDYSYKMDSQEKYRDEHAEKNCGERQRYERKTYQTFFQLIFLFEIIFYRFNFRAIIELILTWTLAVTGYKIFIEDIALARLSNNNLYKDKLE